MPLFPTKDAFLATAEDLDKPLSQYRSRLRDGVSCDIAMYIVGAIREAERELAELEEKLALGQACASQGIDNLARASPRQRSRHVPASDRIRI